eukprot:CAMPEP_0197029354 /NCGR_PEP_ID=MMETSP1384-20130603/8812_1 /TAXON_ID=29189 /ORGANISM="Ammonia sp." /LENGTH=663 /DNA_ID=CAMNT_0042458497 /DNA_START=95 /DNA_END=2086 /DNA_ORIENTATION=-
MAFQQQAPSSTTGIKRKLSHSDGDSDDDVDLVQDNVGKEENVMNPAKRHTESQRVQNTEIAFEERLGGDEDESSDSQYDYTFINDDDKDDGAEEDINKMYIPITESSIKTTAFNKKANATTKDANHRNEDDDDNDIDLAINAQKKLDTALELNWSDEDDCIEAYDSDKEKEAANKQANEQEQQIAWFPAQTDEAASAETKEEEKMKYNKSAYNVLHEFHTEWPCLSFDIIRDNLGAVRSSIPFSMYLVCGSQADPNYRRLDEEQTAGVFKKRQIHKSIQNKIQFLKLSDIQKTKYDDDKDDENEEKDAEFENITDEDAVLQSRDIHHPAIVNRIRNKRVVNSEKHFVAAMSADCNLYIYDGTQHILSLDGLSDNLEMVKPDLPPMTKSLHSDEGYGLAWNRLNDECSLLTGSCAGELRLYQARSASFVRSVQFKTLKASIEDIEWSPQHKDIFISVGVDKCIRVWDARDAKKEHVARIQNAHRYDINVCSWNPHCGHQHLLLTGSDDHSFKIWDLRKLGNAHTKKKESKHELIDFNKKLKKCGHYYLSSWHIAPITSIEWHPNDASCAMVASEDNQITIWDFSLEEDASEKNTGAHIQNAQNVKIPPQLIFMHGGQRDIKEIHFHPQIPNMCVSTANSGFHLFQPDNLMESFKQQFQNLTLVD